ncbi:hypothetical protein O181_022158 [Austropuccinia psidii MF-1]|uniref:Uncharacterized protein n=1 Tax=Austropuccinia psidii MF-1 TaxID=1389203 RepID=A0A9Q3CGA4_9BASI|nr:hypothetical protein [Austropuccinia psidii MF-1]
MPTLPPSSALTTPYAPHPHLIFSLDYNPYAAAGPSSYTSNAALTPSYASLHLPNIPPMLPTILTLAVPSRHASDAPYHPYALPAQHASNAAYHPYTHSALLTCLQFPPHTSLILTLLQPPISALTTPAFSSLPLTIFTLPRRPQDMPLTPCSTPLTPNPLSAAYHCYAQVLDP